MAGRAYTLLATSAVAARPHRCAQSGSLWVRALGFLLVRAVGWRALDELAALASVYVRPGSSARLGGPAERTR
ncbi:MAG: hypothetical protein R2734_05270 [Nocardioides sp.]